MTSEDIVLSFIDRINSHDIDGIYGLMTGDHRIPSGTDEFLEGRDAIRTAWQEYFAMVPDYWIKVESIFNQNDLVGVFGRAGGTYAPDGKMQLENIWEVPSAWLAVIRNGKIKEWHIYCDIGPMRRIMERTRPK